MNYKMIRYLVGQLLWVEGALMVLPLATSLIYGEFKMLLSEKKGKKFKTFGIVI